MPHVYSCFAFLLASTSFGAPPAALPDVLRDEIVVTGSVPQCRLNGRQLGAAMRAYRGGRSRYAPASRLYFEARPGADAASLAGMRLRIVGGGRTSSIAPDDDGRFVLPQGGGEISANCYRGRIAISPLVMSPATTQADRRLGDMRLECEVAWAIVRESLADAPGRFVEAENGCKSSQTGFYGVSHRRLADADVIAGTVSMPVPISADRVGYRVPVGDKRLPDSARVRFRYE